MSPPVSACRDDKSSTLAPARLATGSQAQHLPGRSGTRAVAWLNSPFRLDKLSFVECHVFQRLRYLAALAADFYFVLGAVHSQRTQRRIELRSDRRVADLGTASAVARQVELTNNILAEQGDMSRVDP